MKLSKNKFIAISLLFFLMICSFGNVVIQVFLILFFGIVTIVFKGINNNIYFNTFYITLLILSFVQILFFWRSDYSIPYVVNTLLITLMWVLAFLAHSVIVSGIKILPTNTIRKIIDYFFTINIVLVLIQYLDVCIQAKTLFPFSAVEFGMSTGDYIKGFFTNSSVNMVVMAFFSVYYLIQRKKYRTTIAIIVTLLTTYMSGILIAIAVVVGYGFFKFKLANKIKIVVLMVLVFIAFSIFSPENVKYVKHIFNEKINSKTDPPRKLVSFRETGSNFVSSPGSFLVGEGGGKFSSRTAFLTGGEYVSWYPEPLVYRSEKFENNHFELWNKRALSIPFRDGTANQPFSFYNKIIGEYGLLGIVLFIIYLSYFFKRFKYLTYGKFVLLFILGFFVLDYWFEYFTVMLFFEIFMLLDIKQNEELLLIKTNKE